MTDNLLEKVAPEAWLVTYDAARMLYHKENEAKAYARLITEAYGKVTMVTPLYEANAAIAALAGGGINEAAFEVANSAYIEVIDEIDAPEAINTFALRAAIRAYLTALKESV